MTSRSLANAPGTNRPSAQLSGHRAAPVEEVKRHSRADSLPGNSAKIADPRNDGSRKNASAGDAHNLVVQIHAHEQVQGRESKGMSQSNQESLHSGQANMVPQAQQVMKQVHVQQQNQQRVPVDYAYHDAARRRPASGTTSSKHSAWSGGFSGTL